MSDKFTFWIWAVIISQLLTAFFHSLSFISKPKPRNEKEKQLIELTTNYRMDMGGGIKRSFANLFIGVSTCFTLIYVFGAVLNWYFVSKSIEQELWKNLILIEMIIFGIAFLLQVRFTFLPPIIVTGLVFIFLIGTYFFAL